MWQTSLTNDDKSDQAPLSVSQALYLAKSNLEKIRVTIIGEVSEFNDKPGYKAAYFTLADKQSSLSCLMWRDKYLASGVELKVGVQYELEGFFTAYPAKGRMQFSVTKLKPAGEGNLRQKVAALAKKLMQEGLMEPSRKKQLPDFVERVALITSPRGKAVHDVLRTLKRRNPLVEVAFFGVAVEGEHAPYEMIQALQMADELGLDAILLVRGGGAYEDLMPFNDEQLARCIASLNTVLVSGIGHEPDNSIADMVADIRASTPTAAAERVAFPQEQIFEQLERSTERLSHLLLLQLERSQNTLDRLLQRPALQDARWLDDFRFTTDSLQASLIKAIPEGYRKDEERYRALHEKLTRLAPEIVRKASESLGLYSAKLDALSPLKVLSRGYSLVEQNGTLIDSYSKVSPGDDITIRLKDGALDARVTKKRKLEDKR
ncbi:MAG: exodeoxyribonuclease VII large subunit [Coriobacteriia bacterium]|nr:exodeoxyribonuclease VII large subunit [Coriobacteriia bacterium]